MAVFPTISNKQKLKTKHFNFGLVLTIVFSMLLLNLFFNFFNIFSNIIRGSIGLVAYPICVFFIIIGLLNMCDVNVKATNKTILLASIWLVIFITILQIPTSTYDVNFALYVTNSFKSGITAGGALFSIILYPFYTFLGMIGSYVILSILLIITSTISIDRIYSYYKFNSLVKSTNIKTLKTEVESDQNIDEEYEGEELEDEEYVSEDSNDDDVFIDDIDEEYDEVEDKKKKARDILNLDKNPSRYEKEDSLIEYESDIEESENEELINTNILNNDTRYYGNNVDRKIFIHETNMDSIYTNSTQDIANDKVVDYRSALEDIKKDKEKKNKKQEAIDFLGITQGKFDRKKAPVGNTVVDNVTTASKQTIVSNVKNTDRDRGYTPNIDYDDNSKSKPNKSKLYEYLNGRDSKLPESADNDKKYDLYDDKLTKKSFESNQEAYRETLNRFDTVEQKLPKLAKETYTNEENTNRVEPTTIKSSGRQVTINDISKANQTKINLKPYKYTPPPIDLLREPEKVNNVDDSIAMETGQRIVDLFKNFKLDTVISGCSIGPTFTRYELQLTTPGRSISTVSNYETDLSYGLDGKTIRMQVPIPGKNAFGIEVPNDKRETVYLRSLIESPQFKSAKSPLTFAIGQDISGDCVTGRIDKLIHTLMAGTSGSGKSVALNSILASLLYKASPEDIRLLIIDPKEVEFVAFTNLPHMLVPKPISTVEKALQALDWLIKEMERRYQKFKDYFVKSIDQYNELNQVRNRELPKMYSILLIFDEVADYMSQAKKEIDDKIKRLAAKARAAGIYLMLATQRPTTDVITGTIKANMSSRIALTVKTYIDSKTILDDGGAETLLGYGDMIFAPYGGDQVRLQGSYLDNNELLDILNFIKDNNESRFDESIEEEMFNPDDGNGGFNPSDPNTMEFDPMMKDCLKFFIKAKKASASSLQTYFSIGWPRASKIIMQMEKAGFIGKDAGGKMILFINDQEFEERFGENIDD